MELWALLVSSFLAATILPLASEVPLAVVVRRHGDVALPIAVATVGNYLGAVTTYGLARAAAARFTPQSQSHARHALTIFERHGAPSLLLSWVPIIGDAIVAVAGASRVTFLTFSMWTVLGKAARYAMVAWVALNA
jgi:membrane protein YqaA with SNARE-associated domain